MNVARPPAAALAEVLRGLLRSGCSEAEVLVKRGRSRRVELRPGFTASVVAQERAWAVRAGNRRASLFAAGSGEPPADGPWPEAAGRPLRLPEPEVGPAWNEPSDFDTPLIGEGEGLRLLESLGRDLAAELPRVRLLAAVLEDGASESELASSRGISAQSRGRVATLYLEAADPERPAAHAAIYLAARAARAFEPGALARRLADHLAVRGAGEPAALHGGKLLLAPPVAARLIAGLLPLVVGPDSVNHLTGLRDRRGRIGSDLLTLIDNGRLAGAPLEAPHDGEGVPSREVVLVESGLHRQPLLAWWQTGGGVPGLPSGCCLRPSWRDLPAAGPTHLYLQPDPSVAVADLLGAIDRGTYLIGADRPMEIDWQSGRFALEACGFALERGRAAAPVARARLTGSLSSLLHGVAGAARDLTFFPLHGLVGSPTLLLAGRGLGLEPGSRG